MTTFEALRENILKWANERDLLKAENAKTQFLKVSEEVGELASAILKSDKAKQADAIGDVLVTLIIQAEQLGFDCVSCLYLAYQEIKDRKGITTNGTFIKEV